MRRIDLRAKVRRFTRDTNASIFSNTDIDDYINEAINRFKISAYFKSASLGALEDDSVTIIPDEFQYLIAVYATARCFDQDERFYQGGQRMNEFENKLEELMGLIEEGKVVINDENGEPIVDVNEIDAVVDVYGDSNVVEEFDYPIG